MSDSLPILAKKLHQLHVYLRQTIISNRGADPDYEAMSRVESVTAADTIFSIDRVTEEALFHWFTTHWPAEEPVTLIVEGCDPTVFPSNAPNSKWQCLIDPIDGTRNLMFDKRPAWILTALAPDRGQETRLRDTAISLLTEIPVSKQLWAEEIVAIRGCGRDGVEAQVTQIETGEQRQRRCQPSRADSVVGGFAAISRFFPEGKTMLARVEEQLWEALLPEGPGPMVFEDQYASTGGQFHQLLTGRDRMLADLRPLVFRALGMESALACHPYDAGAALILEEAGCVLLQPDGQPLDAPFDTTSPVSWIGYANATLAKRIQPVLQSILHQEGLL